MELEASCFKFSDISFCDRRCDNITSMEFKGKIIKTLKENYNINVTDRYFVQINPNILRNVANHQHLMTVQTQGNPYLLFLTRVNNVNCCFFVDKKLKNGYTYPRIVCVKYRFDDSLFNGTVFWGELVRDVQQRWMFILSDILIYRGESLKDKNTIYKTELIYDILTNYYKNDPTMDVCPIQVKKTFTYKEFNKMTNEFMPNLSYRCRGICFNTLSPKHSSYLYIFPRNETIQIKQPQNIQPRMNENVYGNRNGNNRNGNRNDRNGNNHNGNNRNENNRNGNRNGNVNDSSQYVLGSQYRSKQIVEAKQVSSQSYLNQKLQNSELKTFKIIKTGTSDIYNLYCFDSEDGIMKHSIALIPNLRSSKYINSLFVGNDNNFNILVDCKYSKKFGRWAPVQLSERDDPNTLDEINTFIEDYITN